MHIKMSWMKSIKCLPPILQKTSHDWSSYIITQPSKETSTPGLHHTLKGEACIRIAGSKDGERSLGRGGVGRGLPWWDLKTRFLFHAHCSCLLLNMWTTDGSCHPYSLILIENTTRNSERLETSPHVQFYIHSLDMCTHNIMSEQTLLCPVTILLEYKLISKLLESSRLLVNKRQRRADTEQNLR